MEHVVFLYNSGERRTLPAHQAGNLQAAGLGSVASGERDDAPRKGLRKSPRNKMTAPDVEK